MKSRKRKWLLQGSKWKEMSGDISYYYFLFPAHQIHNILLLSSGLLINGYGAHWLVGWTCREESEQMKISRHWKNLEMKKKTAVKKQSLIVCCCFLKKVFFSKPTIHLNPSEILFLNVNDLKLIYFLIKLYTIKCK